MTIYSLFMKKMQIAVFSEKFKLFLILLKKWNSVSLYLKKLPMLYGIKMKIYLKIYNFFFRLSMIIILSYVTEIYNKHNY